MSHNNSSKRESENRHSSLLNADENEQVFQLIGRKCITLSTAVVQVVMTYPPHHREWHKEYFGIACFVKDNLRRSYFIRILDLVRQAVVWEQELYSQFTYHKSGLFLHCFEAHDCMAGLSFASESEAESFYETVEDKLRQRQQKKQERRKNQGNAAQPTQAGISLPSHSASSHSESASTMSRRTKKSKKRPIDRKSRITKADIGLPTDFKHVQHVGFKSSTGLKVEQMDNMESDLSDFFKVAGISDKDLQDKDTRAFIYDFIDRNGGIKNVNQENVKTRAPPPVPARDLPPTPKLSARNNAPPPPPPARTTPVASPSRNAVAPPPPPLRGPVGLVIAASKPAAPTPPPPPPPPPMINYPPSEGVPPPPPPPPPPPFLPMDMPPSSGSRPDAGGDTRSALLAQIREGKNLQQVDISNNLKSQSQPDTRGALLTQIRKGVELKIVAEMPRNQAPTPPPQIGLAGMLKQAMQERARVIQFSESESGDDDDDESRFEDDDWE